MSKMLNKRLKKILILITVFLYVILLACFTHSDISNYSRKYSQQGYIEQTYGRQHGIDPTPLPPKPNPDVSK